MRTRQNNHQPVKKSRSNIHKILLDIGMTSLMILLMKIAFTGMLLHELAGVGVFVLFFVHNILNWNCTKNMLKRVFSRSTKFSIRFGILLDMALAVVLTFTVGTGVLLSRELFSFEIPSGLLSGVSSLHHAGAYLGLVLISVHVGLHWSSIMAAFRRMFNLKTLNKGRVIVMRVITLAIVVLGIKGSYSQDVYGNIAGFAKASEDLGEEEQAVGSYVSSSDDDEGEDGDDSKSTVASASTQTTVATVTNSTTLEDYLSNLHCTGCSRHCPLTAPQCSTGVKQATAAETAYNTQVAAQSSNGTTTDTDTDTNITTTTTTGSNEPATTTEAAAVPSLEEYLSKLHCNLCPRHCPLTDPQCVKGEQAAISAKADYYAAYGQEGAAVEEDLKLKEVLTDYMPIMGLYIAGTHYLMLIPKYLGKKDQGK